MKHVKYAAKLLTKFPEWQQHVQHEHVQKTPPSNGSTESFVTCLSILVLNYRLLR